VDFWRNQPSGSHIRKAEERCLSIGGPKQRFKDEASCWKRSLRVQVKKKLKPRKKIFFRKLGPEISGRKTKFVLLWQVQDSEAIQTHDV